MEESRLVLASTSPYRRELLARLQIPFQCARPQFQEVARSAGSAEEASAIALQNARGKVESLRGGFPGSLILGSDQVCESDGRILHKAGTKERAKEQLAWLAGREHRLHTAVALLDAGTGEVDSGIALTHLRVRPLSPEQVERYVEAELPLDSAGSYYSEGLGIALFEYLRGDDPTAIIGLPLTLVCRLLERHGLDPLDTIGAEPMNGPSSR